MQKSYILNAIEETVTLINQMNKQQLYALSCHFFESVVETRDSYNTLDYYDQDNSRQHIITEKKNYTKAFNCLKKAADKDYPPAIHQLGIMYHCEYGVDKDIEQGEKHFNEVVNDDPEYIKSIAMLYHTHDGMQNFAKALQWYKRLEKRLDEDLTDSGRGKINKLVQVGLGLLYKYGGGVAQDYQKALRCYKGLVDKNMGAGFHRLGLMYYYGKGVLVDYKEALSLFEKATRDMNQWNYKLPFVYPQTGVHTDDNQSNLIFCTIALLETKGESYYYLGMMHKNGQDIFQDEEKAQGYFREALYHRCKRAKYEVVH
jgi:TPR repeat protein